MTTYIFTDPSGKEHEVTGPAGSTKEQAFQVLQGQLATPAPVEPAAPTKRPETSLGERIQTGLMDPIVGAAQIMERTGIPGVIRKGLGIESNMDDVTRQRDAEYQAPEGVDWGRMGGNILNPVSWAGGGTGVGRAALAGATQSVLAPTAADLSAGEFASEKATQAGLGAAGGAVLSKTMAALGRGFKPTQAARELMQDGIQPSFGQSMGGVVNTAEKALAEWPLVGGAITRARERPVKDFEQAALKSILPNADAPGVKAEPLTVRGLNDTISNLYTEPVEALRFSSEQRRPVAAAIGEALKNPRLAEPDKKILDKLATDYYSRLSKLSGADLKALDSEMGYDIRRYAKGDPSAQALADSLGEIQQAIRKQLTVNLRDRGMGDLAEQLTDMNRAFRAGIAVNKATSKNAEGKLLPRAYAQALARQQNTDVSRLKDPLVLNMEDVVGLQSNGLSSEIAGLKRGLGTAGAIGGGAALGGLGWPAATLLATAHAGATRPVQAALVGNTSLQRALPSYDERVARYVAAALRGNRKENQK